MCHSEPRRGEESHVLRGKARFFARYRSLTPCPPHCGGGALGGMTHHRTFKTHSEMSIMSRLMRCYRNFSISVIPSPAGARNLMFCAEKRDTCTCSAGASVLRSLPLAHAVPAALRRIRRCGEEHLHPPQVRCDTTRQVSEQDQKDWEESTSPKHRVPYGSSSAGSPQYNQKPRCGLSSTHCKRISSSRCSRHIAPSIGVSAADCKTIGL